MDVGPLTSGSGLALHSPPRAPAPPAPGTGTSRLRDRLEAALREVGEPGTPYVRTRFGLLLRFDDDFPLITFDRAEFERRAAREPAPPEHPPAVDAGAPEPDAPPAPVGRTVDLRL